MVSHTTRVRVRYADTDQMQFAYNGKYLEYFEVGRTELIRSLGLSYRELEEAGYQLPLLEAFVKYIKPAYYDDLLNIEAVMKKIPVIKLRIDYKITRDSTGELVTEGYTSHAFISTETKKPAKAPEVFTNIVKERNDG